MHKNTIRLRELLKVYLKNSASDLEQAEFTDYVNDPFYAAEIKKLIGQEFELHAPGTELNEQEQYSILEYIYAKDKAIHSKPGKLWSALAAAAAIAVMVFAAGLFYYKLNSNQQKSSLITYKNDVGPGKFGATLTLANGQKIRLDTAANGEIAKEAGISITKTAGGQVVYNLNAKKAEPGKRNILSTARGETYMVVLPDRSKVWLNAASSLTYNAALLEHGVRSVKLTGEAYFEISQDKAHPFVVQSRDQEVEVLGTHFNVNAYKAEKALRTTLLEGSVKVSGNGQSRILVPGNQAIYDGRTIGLTTVDADLIIAWKDNNFVFNSQRIEDIMPMIERWYDVEVIYNGEPTKSMFWGSVSRFDNVSKVLSALENTGNVHFKINGRKIYVSQ